MNPIFEDNREQEDLSEKALQGGFISIAGRIVNAIIQFATIMILARLIAPEDFGLVAIAAAIAGFAPSLIDFGLTDATVQRPKITPSMVSAMFWLSLGVSLFLALSLLLGSPIIARVYNQPSLLYITSTMAAEFVFYGLSVQHLALLRRSMRFKDIAIIEICARFLGSTVAIGIALTGGGYWALVARPLLTAFFLAMGAFYRCRWTPGIPKFDAEVKSMLKFGLNVTGFTVTSFLARAMDRILLGFIQTPKMVGFYQNALTIYDNAVLSVIAPASKVGVTALSKLQGDDERLKEKYLMALSTVSFYCAGVYATLSILSPDVVPLLLGERWIPSGAILSILALRGIFHPIESSQAWLHLPLGRPDRWMKFGMCSTAVHLIGILGGFPYGVMGVAVGIVVSRSLLSIPAVVYAGRSINIGYMTVLRTVGGQLIGAAAIVILGNGVLSLLPEDADRIIRICIGTLASAVIYLTVAVGLCGLKDPLRLGVSTLRKAFPGQ